MSVAQALQDKANERRINFGLCLQHWIDQRFGTRSEFLIKVYGRSASGGAAGTGQLYPILKGTGNLTDHTLGIWCSKLGIDRQEILDLYDKPPPPGVKPIEGKKPAPPKKTRDKPAPNPDRFPVALQPAPAPEPERPEQFALVIGADGLAELRLRVGGLTVKQAMRALSALTGAGVLDGPDASDT